MLDVPGIDEDFTVDGLELVGAWSEHLRDDVWSLPWWRELVPSMDYELVASSQN